MHFHSDICKNELKIDSNGTERERYFNTGRYHYYQLSNGKPSFIKYISKNVTYDYLYWAPDEQWKVCNANDKITIMS